MQVLLEESLDLERHVRIILSRRDIFDAVDKAMRDASKKVKLDGFRPGKVPLKEVERRYGEGIRREELSKLVQSACQKAVSQENLRPVDAPVINFVTPLSEIKQLDGDFILTAVFEVYPNIKLSDFAKLNIKKLKATVSETDIDEAIAALKIEHATYNKVDRIAKEGDRVVLNFEGRMNDVAFEGGTAENFELDLGSKRFIPGFEDGLVGLGSGDEKVLALKFPQKYHDPKLSGQDVEFICKIHEVKEPTNAEIDEEFCKKLGVEEGGEVGLRKHIHTNLERELERVVRERLKAQVMEVLLSSNTFDVPKKLIKNEVSQMQQQVAQREGEKNLASSDPELAFAKFSEEAKRRVRLGLLIGQIVDQYNIQVTDAQLRQAVDSMASGYKEPQAVVKWYYENKDRLSQVKYAILEEMVIKSVVDVANVVDVACTYREIINGVDSLLQDSVASGKQENHEDTVQAENI